VSRRSVTGLLVDCDGVLRRWDAGVAADAERRHGLPPGSLAGTAMHWSRLEPAITGRVSHAEWMAGVARELGAPAAVAEWQRYRGEVDPDVLAFVREVRAAGRPVGLATNATDLLDADLVALGLAGECEERSEAESRSTSERRLWEFDAVVNSSVVGVPKPAREYFAAACRAIGLPPDRVLFVDDDDRCVAGARAAGLAAYRWNGPADLPYLRGALGLP
jgi:putative hydrolase of the HAD superfamily